MQNKDWPNIAGLIGEGKGDIGFLGAPMTLGCVTPSDYHLAPAKFRQALKRISTYDVETGIELNGLSIRDYGDVVIEDLIPKDGFLPIKTGFSKLIQKHVLSALIGGHNGITRAGVHALGPSLQNVGLLTLDAHFDLRSTKDGLMNGNPVQALLDDGLPGTHIAQVGIAPFANSAAMHRTAIEAGISVYTMADCRAHSVVKIVEAALKTLSKTCEFIYVDFDIDVIERALSPGAPGGR
ncbi:MAG: arginase family protein, partial [Robiginitomaculum sp.]|nr:arginase family protein [Robiginitomaculum sp.]